MSEQYIHLRVSAKASFLKINQIEKPCLAGLRLLTLALPLLLRGGPKVNFEFYRRLGLGFDSHLANVFAGFIVFFWILCPILYYKNAFYTGQLPLLSSHSFDNTGAAYNVTAILNDDLTINLEKYHAYSPLFLSATFTVSYGLSFASITATIVHAILYFRKQIWVQARRSLAEQPDIHARLMSRYRQVPEW